MSAVGDARKRLAEAQDVEALATELWRVRTRGDSGDLIAGPEIGTWVPVLAEGVLASGWLAARERVEGERGEARGMRTLAGQFQQRGLSEAARIASQTADAVDLARLARGDSDA